MSEVTAAPAETSSPIESQAEEPSSQSQPNAEPKQAMPAALKEKFKLTVDGEEFEEELDWNDKDSIRKKLQLARVSEKRMAEAKDAKAKAFNVAKMMENPEEYLRKLGPKGREAAEKFLLEQIQESMLTPEQKEQRAKDAKLKMYEEKEENEAKSKAERELAEKSNRFAQDYQTTIVDALEKLNLPKSPALVRHMAGLMKAKLVTGIELDATDLAELVKRDRHGELQAIIKDMDGDQLLAFFGDDVANKIRKSDIRKIQEKHGQVFQSRPINPETPAPKADPNRPKTMEEWKEEIERRVRS